MAWNQKYWDIIHQYYWWPKYLGLRSIQQQHWTRDGELVCVPRELVNPSGPLYTRDGKIGAVYERLKRGEEPLNDFFDLTFAIAPDAVIAELLAGPLGIEDSGPFESVGKEIAHRYGWGEDNVTMQDGFFESRQSLVSVELKLKAQTSAVQLVKYMALLVLEEERSGERNSLGLLYIAPSKDEARFWPKCGLAGPNVDGEFFSRLNRSKLNLKMQGLLDSRFDRFVSVAKRLRLVLISWSDHLAAIERSLERLDQSKPGEQTLYRLLSGYAAQLREHQDTGIVPAG